MNQLILPLANWNYGTILIIIFALVCVGLTALVLSFVLGGKTKLEDNQDPSDNEKL